VIPWAQGNGLWGSITGLVTDLVAVDVITFFVRNPYAYDTVEGLAVRVGRRPEQVAPILETLVDADLLTALDLGVYQVYEMTLDPGRRQTLQQYVAWLQEGFHWARMVMDR
jgi:hypothetical protein